MAHHQVVAAQQVLLRPRRSDARRQAIGHREVAEQDPEEERREQHHQDDLGAEHRDEHVLVAEGVEPQVVGPEARYAPQRQQQDEERRHDATDQQAELRGTLGAAPPGTAEGTPTGWRGIFGAHGESLWGGLRPPDSGLTGILPEPHGSRDE